MFIFILLGIWYCLDLDLFVLSYGNYLVQTKIVPWCLVQQIFKRNNWVSFLGVCSLSARSCSNKCHVGVLLLLLTNCKLSPGKRGKKSGSLFRLAHSVKIVSCIAPPRIAPKRRTDGALKCVVLAEWIEIEKRVP